MDELTEAQGYDQIAAALAAFQGEMPTIPKSQVAQIPGRDGRQGYSYRYADLADVTETAMPLLAKHGLAFTALPTRTPDGPLLYGWLLHTSGQFLTGELPIAGRTPQEIGSSLTYGRRYLLCCLTGVVTDDDDDGRLAEKAARVRGGLQSVAEAARSSGRRAPERPAELPSRAPGEASGPDRADQRPLDTRSALARRMYAGIREAGITPEKVHEFMSECIGRTVESSKELTQGEAWRILDYLPERPPVAPEEP